MAEERNGLERLIGRVKRGLERTRSAVARERAAKQRRAPEPQRQRPYLEALEPRVLLSADVGLVPDALLAPPPECVDTRLLVETAVHDNVLVREPSKFDSITRDLMAKKRADQVTIVESAPVDTATEAAEADASTDPQEKSADVAPEADADADATTPEDPDAAARALGKRVWQAGLIEELAQSTSTSQVIVVDARIPEVDSLLEALLEGVGGDVEAACADEAKIAACVSEPGVDDAPSNDEAGSDASEGANLLPAQSEEAAEPSRAEKLARALEARGVAVVVLDAGRDGLEQLEEIARAYQGVGAMHVVSHGARGSLSLGNSKVTSETLRARAGLLAGLRDSLGEDGDLLLYGCDVADGEVGIEFVTTLAELAGVDVAASTDLTGAAHLGGDWDLEFATGEIETPTLEATGFDGLLGALTLPLGTTSFDGEVRIYFDNSVPGSETWRLEVSGGGAFINNATPPPNTEFDLLSGEDVTITLGDDVDTITLDLDSANAAEDFTGNITINTVGGEDVITLEGDGTAFTGTVTLSGGDDADSYTVANGFDPGALTSITLGGGNGGDTYDLSNVPVDGSGNVALSDLTIEEADSGAGDDVVRYAAPVAGDLPLFVDSDTGLPSTQAELIEQTETVAAGTLTSAQVQSVLNGLEELSDQLVNLGSSGEFALDLAGIRGNVGVTLGGAIDLDDVLDQLILYIEANRDGLTTDTLRDRLAAFTQTDVENFDRTLFGAVIASTNLDHSEFGFTLELDDDSYSFGLAAQSSVTMVGVALRHASGSSTSLTFTRESNDNATLRRSDGGWKADGFRVGQTIRLSTDLTEDTGDTGVVEFEIEAISGDDRVIVLKDSEATGTPARTDFDKFLDDDDDNANELPSRRNVSLSDGSQISVARTLFVEEGDPSFRDAGFNTGQAIELIVGAGTASAFTIDELSEDGRVITVKEGETLPSFTLGTSAQITGKTFSSNQSLSDLATEINAIIGDSDLNGRVKAIVTEVSTSVGSETARLGFQVLETSASELTLKVIDVEPVGSEPTSFELMGFDPDVDHAPEGLADELTGLGDLDVRVSGPAYRVSTFSLEQPSTATLTNVSGTAPPSETFDASANEGVTFSVGENGRGTLTRNDGADWDSSYDDSVIAVSGTNFNDGTYAVVDRDGSVLTLERTLTATGTAGSRTLTRTEGSWSDDGFAAGEIITLDTGSGAIEATIVSIVDDFNLEIEGTEAELPAADTPFTATIRHRDPVELVYDANENTFTYNFRYEGERESQFNVDLGTLAAEKGVVFASDVSVKLNATFEAQLSFTVDLDENGAGVADEDATTSTTTLEDLTVGANVNTPEAPISDLPTNGANSDLARSIFTRNIDQGKTADIGFLGAEVSDGDESTGQDGFIALRATLTGSGTDADAYASDSFLALDIPIRVKEGLVGLGSDLTPSISSLNPVNADPELVFDTGSVFEGQDALGDDQLFQGFDGDVERFANIDAPGFVRLLGEIRTGLQRVNDSDLLRQFDVPLIEDGLAALTNLANVFGNAILYDDGGDGLDRDNTNALITDLNKKLEGSELEGLVEFRVIEAELGASSEEERTFALVAIDRTVTSLGVSSVTGDSFFGLRNATNDSRDSETGALEINGEVAFDPAMGRLTSDQSATISITISGTRTETLDISFSVGDTSSNAIVGNDTPKLLDANNAPTFSTAQELSQKLIELAIDAIGLEGLSFVDNELLFDMELEYELFATEFDIDFDLDLGPVGGISTVGSPKISVSGDVGFSIQFGIDLSDSPNGAVGITESTPLTDLRGIDELSDLIKTDQAVTIGGDSQVVTLNQPDPDTPDEELIGIELDLVRMATDTELSFGSVDFVAPSAEQLVGEILQIVAPSGYLVQIYQELDGEDRLTANHFQQQALILPRPRLDTTDPPFHENVIDEPFTFWIAVYEADGPIPTVSGGMPDTSDPAWVEVTVTPPDGGLDVSERRGRNQYIALVESAIRNAQSSEVSNTITRTTGDWLDEGFAVGQMIVINGAGTNSGLHEITALTGDTITVRQDLTATSAPINGAQVEGAGKITASQADAFAGFEAGRRIQITGSLRSDGSYLITRNIGDDTLILSDAVSPESMSTDIQLSSEGDSLRLNEPVLSDPDDEAQVEADELAAAAEFDIVLDGTAYGIVIFAAESESDPFAPHTADNRSPNDLLQDLRVALTRATSGGETIDLTDEDRSDRIVASLDGSRLVLTREGDNSTVPFTISGANANAQRLGFEASDQLSNSADLVIVLSNGDEAAINLDSATTVGDVLAAIEAAFPADGAGPLSGSRVEARVAANGTGIEIVERGQLTGRLRLTVSETAGSDTVTFVRSAGSWSDDGFSATGNEQRFEFEDDTYIVTDVDDSTSTLTATLAPGEPAPLESSERFVNDAKIRIEGVEFDDGDADTDDDIMVVELINGSVAAANLGILQSDAAADVNEDDSIDVLDADGLIQGNAIGGASLFDRIFIRDPNIFLGFDLAPVGAVEVNARVGFVEADFIAQGGFSATGRLGLNDLPPVDAPNDAPDGKITLREFARGIRNPLDFIDTPKFEAGVLDEDFSGNLTLSNSEVDGEQRGIIQRSVGDWSDDDRFSAGQKVVVTNGEGSSGDLPDGTYRIIQIRKVDVGGTEFSQLVLEDEIAGISGTTTLTGDDIPRMVGTFGVFTLALDSIGADGLGSIDVGDIVGDNAQVDLTLFDFGDPFFRESMGVATTAEPDGPDGPGGSVVATRLNQLEITRDALQDDADEIDSALREVRGALDDGGEVKVKIVYTDKDGNEQSESVKVTNITAPPPPEPGESPTALTFPIVVTLAEDFVDDLANVELDGGNRVIQKITFTRPPKTEVQTPDFGSLLDFESISIRDIIRGLQLAADFLGQFEEFGFLDEPIPVIELSFNDLLDFADQLAAGIEEIQRDPDGTLQTIEARLKDVLGITEDDPFDIELKIASETLAARDGVEASTHKVLKLELTLGDEFQDSIGVNFDVGGGGVIAGSAGLEAFGRAEINIDLGLDISLTKIRGDATLTLGAPGVRTITRSDGAHWAADGFRLGQTLKLKNAGERDGSYTLVAISGDTITLEGGDDADWAMAAPTGLPPIEVTGSRAFSVFNSTGISAYFDARANEVDFRAAAGPVGIFIQDGKIAIGGTLGLDPDNPGDDPEFLTDAPEMIFDAGFLGDNEERRLFTELFDSDSDNRLANALGVEVASGISVALPVYFPTDNLLQGTVGYSALLSAEASAGGIELEFNDDIADGLGFTIQRADDSFVEGDTAGERFANFFSISAFDPGELSLFDNIKLAVDGFDLILGGIQDVLDGEILGIDLPLIGDSLSDGAQFIADLREDFVEPFRDGLDDAESFIDDVSDPNKNIISQLLFDELSKTGLLLVTHAQDGTALHEDEVFTARASNLVGEIDEDDRTSNYDGIAVEDRVFMLSQVIRLNGTRRDDSPEMGQRAYFDSRADGESRGVTDGEIDLAGIPVNQITDVAFIEWDFRLGQQFSAVDADIALDFGIPAIGLEADGALGIELAWDLELGFGLDFDSGFYFDIGSSSELEIDVDVVLPDSLTGRLAFLQLEAENVGSGLGANFAIDIVKKGDPTDDRLSFTELGSLRLEAGVSAEATALLGLELALNEELLADFANVFPTVTADFVFEWALGDREIGELEFDGDTITSSALIPDGEGGERAFSFAEEGYREGHVIRISGLSSSTFDGAYKITAVSGNTLTVEYADEDAGAPDFSDDATGERFRIYRDVRNIDGSVLSEGLQIVEFRDVSLDLGSFISDFAAPVLREIQKVTGPIQPIVDILTSPLPVISDLGPPVTLLDLARMTGRFDPSLIEAIADIITLVNAIPTTAGNVIIGFGDFTIYKIMTDGTTMGTDPVDGNADLSDLHEDQGATATTTEPAEENETTGFVDKLKNTKGFAFPILSDPSQVFGLLTGQEVVLFGYDMPAFELEFEYTQFFPLYGPLGIGITGTAYAKIDFAFGFDSSGLERFFDSGFTNPVLIFDGFYVSDNPEDVTGAGPDLDELQFDLGFFLSAELNLGIARAGVAGGIEASIDFDLFDPNRDGKVRVGEIIENVANEFLFGSPILAPLAIFDVSGIVTARAFAFLEIDFVFFEFEIEIPITPTITLVDFTVEFTRAPKLATILDDGTMQLNMGDFAGERLNDDLRDTGEHFRLHSDTSANNIIVTWVGSNEGGREFFNWFDASDVTGILAIAGAGDDVIDLRGLSAAHRAGLKIEIDGGTGNDRIYAGSRGSSGPANGIEAILRGGEGSDEIVGTEGRDLIFGGSDIDDIDGGGGDDVIFADEGRLVEKQPRERNIPISISGASPGYTSVTLTNRHPDADFIVGGFAEDQTVIIKQFDGSLPPDEREAIFEGIYKVTALTTTTLTLASVSEGEADFLIPTVGDDSLFEIAAQDADFVSAYQSTAGDTDGNDIVTGGFGSDWIFGGGGADSLVGGPTSDTSASIDDLGDIIIGDGGEIRVNREGVIRRDEEGRYLIENTERGLAFGNDTITGSGRNDLIFGGRGDDTISGDAGNDTIFGETGRDTLLGDAGSDTIFGGRDDDHIEGGADGDFLYGEQAADTIYGDSEGGELASDGNDVIRGASGSDLIFGGGGLDDIAGGADFDELHGGSGFDTMRGDAGADLVFGDGGGDHITVRDGDDIVDAGLGSDTVTVNFKGAENSARISISGGETETGDVDDLIINGTARDDQFLLRAAADRINGLTFVASINEGNDVERVDYSGFESLIVNGRAGDDRYALDDLTATATLNGGAGDDHFQVGQLYRNRRTTSAGNIAPEDQFATVEVTRGFLSNGISNDTTINGGNDNDTIIVYRNLATLTVNGQAGDDAIEVRAFALVNPLDKLQRTTNISGGGGADTIRYAVNAPVAIDGGDGLDSVTVIGTEFGDEFVITRDGVFGAGLNVNFVNVELLRVDGAEGDDHFYIQSTNEEILTQVVGGLGSDTFQIADGVERSVVSNDLRGHSGLILHDVESDDPFYQGPELDGIAVDGISTNVGDADEAGIVISQSEGFTRVSEGGVLDWYTVVLTRRPNENVEVTVNAPELSPEGAAQGEDLVRVWHDDGMGAPLIEAPTANEPDPGQNLVLTFTSDNWYIPQTVWVQAADDLAIEEERFGVIQHKVTGQSFESDRATDPSPEITAVTGPEIIDGVIQLDADGDIVTTVDLADTLDLGDDNLRGRLFQVTSAPSIDGEGGVGQSLLIKSSETVGTGPSAFTRITLFGVFDPEDPAVPGSGYLVRMYDGLVVPTVTVQVDDNDAPDVVITPLVDGIASETLGVFELTDENSGASTGNAIYQIELGREPRVGADVVRVLLDITTANFEDEQLEIALYDPTNPTAPLTFSASLVVTFTNATTPQFIQVRAVGGDADGVPEGFHRGLIQHTVLREAGPVADRDVDLFTDVVDERIELEDGQERADSILLSNTPLQFRGDVDVDGGVSDTTISGFGDVSFTIADLAELLDIHGVDPSDFIVRITKGAGEGQLRQVASIDGNTVTIDASDPWETVPDETSRFSVTGVSISLFDEDDNLVDILEDHRFEVNGNDLVFFDEERSVEERVFDYALVSYGFLDPGYEDRVEERLPIRVMDGDSAGVLILESGGSTDVIEVNEIGTGDPGVPDERPEGADDSYQIVLSRPPAEGTPVIITVAPELTPTGRGDLENDPALQVEIRTAGGAAFSRDPIQIVFTHENWNIPQTIEVRAISDFAVDGGDIKAFAPFLRTLTEIQGPLLVDGAGGQGSLEGLAPPVMLPPAPDAGVRVATASDATTTSFTTSVDDIRTVLGNASADIRDLLGREIAERVDEEAGETRTVVDVELIAADTVLVTVDLAWETTDVASIDGFELEVGGETNLKTPTGSVLDVAVDRGGDAERTFVTVRGAEFEAALLGGVPSDLIGLTLEIVRGAGIDQFREIVGVSEVAGGDYAIEVAPTYDIADDDLDKVIAYKITRQSLNFFVDESQQQDLIFIHDEDSPANSEGAMFALDFDQFPAMESIFNGSLDADDPDYIVPNRLTGFGMGGDTTIARGLRPGGITYSNFEGFELDLGYGDNTLFVDTVHDRSDEVETFTRIRTGRGDDRIDVSLQNEPNADGRTPWVEIDAGRDDDVIDASANNAGNGIATTIDLHLVGGYGDDEITGGEADDLIYGDFGVTGFEVVERSPVEIFQLETTLAGEGGRDDLSGNRGHDLIFGGADRDIVRGNAGRDTLFGDYGKEVRSLDHSRRVVETTELFEGDDDLIEAGSGNDLLFGGAGNDALVGNLARDLMVGEYARIRLEDGVATSIIRLGQDTLDVAASTFFGIYDPRFGPFAEFVLPSQREVGPSLPDRPPVRLEGSETTGQADADAPAGSAGGGSAPGTHEVIEGDTLWDIAEASLGDAYRWTEIFELSRDTIIDPDVIEPGQQIRLPDGRMLSIEELEEQRAAVAELRERMDERARERDALAQEGWGFFNPSAVAAGPPDGVQAPPPTPEASETEAPEARDEDEGAQRLDTNDADPELSGLIWSSLVGWKATSNPASLRSRGKWLRFDETEGRFA